MDPEVGALVSRSGCLCDQIMIGQKIGEQTPSPPRLAGKPEGWAMKSTELGEIEKEGRKEAQRLWEQILAALWRTRSQG